MTLSVTEADQWQLLNAARIDREGGTPLSLEDRRRAVRRVLEEHPEWSDRRIASLCGLSGKTVGAMRRQVGLAGRPDGSTSELDRRIGRDGKARPVRSEEVRQRIAAALEEHPHASLRSIAAMAGASPETVRSVRARMVLGSCPTRTADIVQDPAPPSSASERPDRRRGPDPWQRDLALISCGDTGSFARWFSETDVDEQWHDHVWTVPVGRIYDVVDEARRRADAWSRFAALLESRTRG